MYSRMDKVNFVEDRPYNFKYFKGCLKRLSILEYLDSKFS